MDQRSIECGVQCPTCGVTLEFTLSGEATLEKGPDRLIVRYVPITILHSCPEGAGA